jgi:hypothetical protein
MYRYLQFLPMDVGASSILTISTTWKKKKKKEKKKEHK